MKVISFQNWVNIFNGYQVSGFADGDGVVKFEFLGKPTFVVGADGQMVVYLSANKSAKVTLSLLPTSAANQFFAKIWAAQQAGPKAFIPIEYSAKDAYRQDTVTGWHGFMSSPANLEAGEKFGKRDWEFTFERGTMTLGDPAFAGLATAIAEAASAQSGV